MPQLHPGPLERTRQQRIEDELRDPSNFVEYLLPRPLRLSLSLFGAISCLVATIISGTQLISVSSALPLQLKEHSDLCMCSEPCCATGSEVP